MCCVLLLHGYWAIGALPKPTNSLQWSVNGIPAASYSIYASIEQKTQIELYIWPINDEWAV